MKGWNGDIGRAVQNLVNGMVFAQRTLVARNSKTGALLRAVGKGRQQFGARGIETTVGANAGDAPLIGVAFWNDQGTKRHVIRPRPSNTHGTLVFFWAKVGHVVYLKKVNHPGNRKYDWAMRGAEAALIAWDRTPGM